jgi:hypothetical protein
MQKANSIRRMKWAAEDAYLLSVGVENAVTGWRSWKESWDINTKNRDRPGGHLDSNYNVWKKALKKKLRREHKKITVEALRDYEYEQDCYIEYGYDDIDIGIKRNHEIWWDEYQESLRQEYFAFLEAEFEEWDQEYDPYDKILDPWLE